MADEYLEFHNLRIDRNSGSGIQISRARPRSEADKKLAAEWRAIVRAKNPAFPPYVPNDEN